MMVQLSIAMFRSYPTSLYQYFFYKFFKTLLAMMIVVVY